jgi:hypothetical protein
LNHHHSTLYKVTLISKTCMQWWFLFAYDMIQCAIKELILHSTFIRLHATHHKQQQEQVVKVKLWSLQEKKNKIKVSWKIEVERNKRELRRKQLRVEDELKT